MKPRQLYYILAGSLAVLLLSFFGVAYAANTLLSSKATQLSKLRADGEVVDTLQTKLDRNKRDIAKYKDLNTVAETIVPQDKDQAEAVREIANLAVESGIKNLTSITFPVSTLGVAGSSGANSNLTQLTPVKDIKGVYQLPITVAQAATSQIPYDEFITFLSKLEQNRRTAQVVSINLTPDSSNPDMVSFILVVNEFIKP